MSLVYSGASATGTLSQTMTEAAQQLSTQPESDSEVDFLTIIDNPSVIPSTSIPQSSNNMFRATQSTSRKRSRTNTGPEIVTRAVDKIVDALRSSTPPPSGPIISPKSKIEEAIQVLEEQYGEILSVEELVSAAIVFENELKAQVFLTFKNDTNRIAWLRKQIFSLDNN